MLSVSKIQKITGKGNASHVLNTKQETNMNTIRYKNGGCEHRIIKHNSFCWQIDA